MVESKRLSKFFAYLRLISVQRIDKELSSTTVSEYNEATKYDALFINAEAEIYAMARGFEQERKQKLIYKSMLDIERDNNKLLTTKNDELVKRILDLQSVNDYKF